MDAEVQVMINAEAFTGKAQAYAEARPSYPNEAMEYICKIVPQNATIADIGAGTGKFTELLAKHRYEIIAVEPNLDMREQLAITLAPFPNTKIVDGTAEATTLPSHSVDVITCAQAIGWFDLDAFRVECQRIGKPGAIIISIYNYMPGDNFIPGNNRLTNKRATDMFFENPTVQGFPNPVFYTRERWLQKHVSLSDSPKPSDVVYKRYLAEANEIFDRESVDSLLCHSLITKVYSEEITRMSR